MNQARINLGKITTINTYETNFNGITDYDLSLNYNSIYKKIKGTILKKGFPFDDDVYIQAITEWFMYVPKDNFKNLNLLIVIYINRKKNEDGVSKSYRKNKFNKDNIIYTGNLFDLSNKIEFENNAIY